MRVSFSFYRLNIPFRRSYLTTFTVIKQLYGKIELYTNIY
jgi:hypothetical protein